MPAAYGLFRPVVLLPASWVTGLPEETIRAILVHELSHLRQLDPLAQAFQQVVEAIFFFNPSVWLLSRQIGLEREASCDRAVSERVDPAAYAQWLLDLSRGRSATLQSTFAATGDGGHLSLRERVRRLIRPGERAEARFSMKLLLPAMALALLSIFLARQAADAVVAAVADLNWVQRVEAVLELERKERLAVEWVAGDTMKIAGTLTDSSGQPIENGRITLNLYYADGSKGMSASVLYDEEGGTFSREIELTDWPEHRPYGSFSITALAPGYNPVELGRTLTGKSEASFDIEMEPGVAVDVIVENANGEPLPNAQITVAYVATGETMNFTHETSTDGVATILVPLQYELGFSVSAEGYRDFNNMWREFKVRGERFTITMEKGAPVRGHVYDRDTGEPIEDAGLFLLRSIAVTGSSVRGFSFWVGDDDPDFRTGKDGSFEIFSLNGGWYHWLAIQKEGYLVGFSGPGDSREVRKKEIDYALTPGKRPVGIGLIPKRELDVIIKLPEGVQPTDDGKIWIRSSHAYSVGISSLSSYSHGSLIQRRKLDFVENEIRFKLTPTIAAPLSIGIGRNQGPSKIIEDWKYGEPMVVDLSDEPAQTVQDVTYHIDFDLPEGAPDPEGRLLLQFVDGSYIGRDARVAIENGMAKVTVKQRLNRDVTVSSKELVGYYFPDFKLPVSEVAADQPFEHTIKDLQRAGALQIRISNPVADAETSVHVEKLPPVWKLWDEPSDLWPGESYLRIPEGEDELLISPVPFDTKIGLTIRSGNIRHQAETLMVRESESLLEREITLPEGELVAGKVLLPTGEPASGHDIILNLVYSLTESRMTTSHFASRTDAQGRFRFDRVNFDADGVYYLKISGAENTAGLTHVIDSASDNLKLRLEKSPTLRVQFIHSETGAPVVGYDVEAYEVGIPKDKRYLAYPLVTAPQTDEKGWTQFYGLPVDGVFNFRLWIPGDNSRSAVNFERDLPSPINGERVLKLIVPSERL